MKINQLQVQDFRNLAQIDVTFEDVNIIWGENAQGKTNLIEAIYLFTGARSFRGAKDKELIAFGKEKCRLQMAFETDGRAQTAEMIIDQKRHIKLNGVNKNAAALSEELRAIIFSPVHLGMIKDGPRERRHFVDGALCQMKANYRKLLQEYQRALVQRNALLKDLIRHPEMEDMLYIWNQNLARLGAKIIYQRLKYIEALTPYVTEIFAGISKQKEQITLQYAGCDTFSHDVEAIEAKLLKAFEEARLADMVNRITTKGPQRDDISILINGNSARTYSSQGQQRSCVLALKLAEAALLSEMTGTQPIALLDDVMSELDESRQDYILNHIKSTQVFITCCDKETILRLKQGKSIHLKNGKTVE